MSLNKLQRNSGFSDANTLEKLSGFYSIFTNCCNELFVQYAQDGPVIRITGLHHDTGEIGITCHDGVMTPFSTNGLPQIRINKR